MIRNTNQRMVEYLKGLLIQQNFNVFSASTSDQSCNVIIRNIKENNIPQYMEIQILSRTEEYNNELVIPVDTDISKGYFCYFILYSPGMGKMWLLRSDELIKLRSAGLDARDTSPYLVKNFDRLKFPELTLAEYKKK